MHIVPDLQVRGLWPVGLDGDGSVEEDGEDGLGGAGVVDNLSGEEEVLIVLGKGVLLLNALGPLEEEDETVDIRFYPGE